MALCAAIQEGVFLRQLLADIGVKQESATVLFEDNQGCIALANNPVTSVRSKHIDIKYHFVREQINKGAFKVTYCPTDRMIADCLTKPLADEKFSNTRDNVLGVINNM